RLDARGVPAPQTLLEAAAGFLEATDRVLVAESDYQRADAALEEAKEGLSVADRRAKLLARRPAGTDTKQLAAARLTLASAANVKGRARLDHAAAGRALAEAREAHAAAEVRLA